jgi:UDP-N-acetylmuramate dehydrogenase
MSKKKMTKALSNSQAKDLEKLMPGKVKWDCPLASYTTLRVGGPAEAVVHAESGAELARLLEWLRARNIPRHIIGGGSNILIPDVGLTGVVVMLGRGLAAIETLGQENDRALVRAGAGCRLAGLLKYCTDRAFSGLEFVVGIPGSVGGAIVMNAGCWGREISDVLSSVTMLDPAGELIQTGRDTLDFSYRQWSGGKESVIVAAVFALAKGDTKNIKAACRKYLQQRKEKQPQHLASAGSFFKNPPGRAAGGLIEESGLKGHRVGGAMVSPEHANFIVNTGTATAGDILALMRKVQSAVFDRSGIMLEPEVQILENNACG